MVMCMGGGRPWEVASRASSRARGRTPKLSINHAQGSLSLSIIVHKRDTGSSAPLRHGAVRKHTPPLRHGAVRKHTPPFFHQN